MLQGRLTACLLFASMTGNLNATMPSDMLTEVDPQLKNHANGDHML